MRAEKSLPRFEPCLPRPAKEPPAAGTRQFIVCTKFYNSDAESEVEFHPPLLRPVVQNEADRAERAMRENITRAGERRLLKMLTNLAGTGTVRPLRRRS